MVTGLVDLIQGVAYYLESNEVASILFRFSFVVGAVYAIWRIWAFTLLPMLRPHEPLELPYWIPYLGEGHAFDFLRDAQVLVSNGKKYFRNSTEPFTLTVGGKKLYIVTSAADVNAVYRNNATLSWDAMLNDLLIAFGVNSVVIPKLWQKPNTSIIDNTSLRPSRKDLSPLHATLDHYKKQLLPGEKLEKFGTILFSHLSDSLRWENLAQRNGESTRRISLYTFCGEVLVEALSRTMFGNRIFELEPGLVQCMLDFNDDAWMLMFHVPQPPESKLHKARHRLLAFFVKFMQGPEEMRSEKSWLISRVLEDLKAIDMSDEDKAPLLLLIYWGGNINPYKFAFWMITYILFDAELQERLRRETAPAFQGNDIDLTYLMTGCPCLNALFLETLRVTSGALSARKVVTPTVLGNRILGRGDTILIPLRQLHYDEVAFGNDPDHFDAKRFLRHKDLKNSPSFRPFGGGVSHCPGQVLAKQEMLVFVALMLHRFDMKVAALGHNSQSQTFPKRDESTPSLGVNGPAKGSDIFVDLRKREA